MPAIRRRAVLLLVSALLGTGLAATTGPAVARDLPPVTDALRLNQIQFIGTHNSYHQMPATDELPTSLAGSSADGFRYQHASLTDQLGDQRIRAVELDLDPDPTGGRYRYPLVRRLAGHGPLTDPEYGRPGIKVLHSADVDYRTSCISLRRCLGEIRAFSDSHPRHTPILIQLELKSTDATARRLGGVDVPAWDRTQLTELDREIAETFRPQDLITPDSIRQPGRTVEQSVRAGGWPTLGSARGRVMFFFDNASSEPGAPSRLRAEYLRLHPGLRTAPVFTRGAVGQPDAAVTMVNDPRGPHLDEIRRLVAAGYLVRTRADEPMSTVKNDEHSRVAVALASGAQDVTTDFPVPGVASRWGDGTFVAQLPGTGVVRSNPISAR
ncbi:Ca2+-dependent phosphoinositide-specific phospholipase C [Williamsia maris]|uniref:Phosphoinositide phospholipase C, Ca2+-dependent n=1 Tax=Williamsia maris TaxID=72806 RepID=A0ABT1HAB4_9NOCA|nr:Ca2+-dependent phosphoinositide-specific phospholipase C [Williamsia maris]MCP2174680.1 Phosphoinositide phospholipase C, Ca2+-dependent [Williamsia maris]